MAKTKEKQKKKRSTPRNPGSAFTRNLSKLMDPDGPYNLTLNGIAKLAGGIPKTTVFSWTLGHNPKIDSVFELVKNLRAKRIMPDIDFQEFLTGEPRLDVKAEAKVEDFFEDGTEALSGIYRVTLTHLVPRGSKLPSKRKT